MELKIGKKITALRKEKGMTQEQLATALGISSPAVSKWETDNSYPDITLICSLARALGTDVNELLSYEEFLSEERVKSINQEVMTMIFQGKTEQAEEMITNLLKEYPSDMLLKFSAISKSCTPISNGGLLLVPPGHSTSFGKAEVHNHIFCCLPPLEAL